MKLHTNATNPNMRILFPRKGSLKKREYVVKKIFTPSETSSFEGAFKEHTSVITSAHCGARSSSLFPLLHRQKRMCLIVQPPTLTAHRPHPGDDIHLLLISMQITCLHWVQRHIFFKRRQTKEQISERM